MSWAQKDDGSWTDSTLSALSHIAYRLHDNCWTFAANKLTDGRLTADEVRRVSLMFGISDSELSKAIDELLTWQVWTRSTTAYEMVGWLDQNRSRAEVLAGREKTRKRQARWRRKAHVERREK
jgi:hypothetical protein